MLTSFEAISLYAVLSGLLGIATGSRFFPSAKALARAREAGRRRGNRQIWDWAEGLAEEGRVYRLGPHGKPGWCDAGSQWDRDGANAYYGFDMGDDDEPVVPRTDVPSEPGESPAIGVVDVLPARSASRSSLGQEAPGVVEAVDRSRHADHGNPADSLDWGDELSGMRASIAAADATEILEAVQPPPTPGTFEYYASERQQEFDHWLSGVQAEFGARKRELEGRAA